MNRRQFIGLCTTLSSSPLAVGAITALSAASAFAATSPASNNAGRTVKFPDGTVVPALGQGSFGLGWGRYPRTLEVEALRTGISLGMTLIDTADGDTADARAEELIGRAIVGQRDRVYLVSKVWLSLTSEDDIARACEASLARLGTDHLDLYLLHFFSNNQQSKIGITDLASIVATFENLRSAGKIRAWGVVNFTLRDMERLFQVPQGNRCATNQVSYSLGHRGIEHDLLPWCERHGLPVMADDWPMPIVRDRTLARIGQAHNCSAAAIALAWVIRSGNVIAIPESDSPAHVKENAVALSLTLTSEELQILDAAHPSGGR